MYYKTFVNCFNVEKIQIDSANTYYDSRDNCNAIIETSSNTLLFGCKNTTIQNTINYINDLAFSNCSDLTSITIPESILSIGMSAFCDCIGLEQLTIPSTVYKIGKDAFKNCTQLTSIVFEGKTFSNLTYRDGYPWGLSIFN